MSTQGTSAAPPSPAIRSASHAPAGRPVSGDGAPAVSTTHPISSGIAGSDQLDNRALLHWMFRFIRPVKGLAVVACIYTAMGVGADVLTTRQIGQAVDHIKNLHVLAGSLQVPSSFSAWIGSADPQAVTLRQLVGVLFALVAMISLLRYLREVANSKFSMNMVFYIREAVYDKVQHVGFGFHDALSSGQLINRALTDLQNVRSFVQTALLTTLEIVLVVSGYIVLLTTRNPYIAVLSIVPLPLWVWYILRFSRRVQPAAKAAMEAGDRNVALITENIAGVHVIKAFATERQEIEKYNGNCDEFLNRTLHRIRLFANFNPIIRLIASTTNLSLTFAVAVLVLLRRLQVGDFLVLQAAMSAILGRLQGVAQINEQYQNAIVSARRLYEVLMADSTVPQRPHAKPLLAGPGNVRFEHVTFGYDASKPVLQDIDIEIKGGSIVAVVGPTGAGKSTLVNLIARFYDPQHGRVVLDGTDLRDVRLDSLRREVAFVFQETYLFSDTIEANIAYGRPHITGGEVEAAARLAQAHEFIEKMPLQYQTILRERGSSLSGGQRQRLAIARALLTNPRVLVLDDATAAVDPETEDLIRKGMKFAMYGRTTFVIAHRLSTVRAADMVIVLEQGRITQVGRHSELMSQSGHYRDIAVAQLYSDHELPGD
ncbi:MAG TPA: ABC transporter ATP-binding protein, partial [Tepidisphaeraceae bacterium]|nr:ABC transporter ATP-binding protein [Tepidisphaeraceae bacterium]